VNSTGVPSVRLRDNRVTCGLPHSRQTAPVRWSRWVKDPNGSEEVRVRDRPRRRLVATVEWSTGAAFGWACSTTSVAVPVGTGTGVVETDEEVRGRGIRRATDMEGGLQGLGRVNAPGVHQVRVFRRQE
jgi:hypothetical protein